LNLSRTHPGGAQRLLGLLEQGIVVMATAAVAALASLAGFTILERLWYAGRVLPGVTIEGQSLTGLNQAQVELALGDSLSFPSTGHIVLYDGVQTWELTPAELGVVMDIPSMAHQALNVGRQGSLGERIAEQYDAWFAGSEIAPIVIFDQRAGAARLSRIASIIDRPTLEAGLKIDGLTVIAEPGQVGRHLQIQATLDQLQPAIAQMHDAVAALVINEEAPRILDASQDAVLAQQALNQPLRLTAEAADPLELSPQSLAEMMRFTPTGSGKQAHYQVELDPASLSAQLEPLAPDLARRPENARFIFNDDTKQLDLLKPAVIGRQLDVAASIQAANAAIAAGQHEAPLAFITTDPVVGDRATAAELGISETVSVVSTYFAGSSPERIHNIATASGAFHGLLIAPGETLSMADILGDISLDTGYAEALIIYGDRTINGVGGGVCQVSTTLFRAVFFGGYPIVERNPHAYRVGYYEEGPNSPGPGLDATVFVPLVDFKFTNDRPYWLLMETYIYGNQLLWKFYSTSDGRAVNWDSKSSNKVDAPKPLYKENDDLPKGEIKQVDYQADGLDVVVHRTVSRDGEILYKDTIKTHYLPWRAIYEYGPDTKLPKGAQTK
jgi:vancomycin resistance protein YoaR